MEIEAHVFYWLFIGALIVLTLVDDIRIHRLKTNRLRPKETDIRLRDFLYTMSHRLNNTYLHDWFFFEPDFKDWYIRVNIRARTYAQCQSLTAFYHFERYADERMDILGERHGCVRLDGWAMLTWYMDNHFIDAPTNNAVVMDKKLRHMRAIMLQLQED